MHKSLFLALSLFLIACQDKVPFATKISKIGISTSDGKTTPITGLGDDKTTIFVFVCRAEKNTEPADNPDLSEAGKIRAQKLAELLKDLEVHRAAATTTKRAIQTAQPLIDMTHCGTDIYSKSATEAFLLSAISGYKGKVILVVGHGNTIPEMLNMLLGEKKYEDIAEDEYDNIYIASVIDKGNTKVVHYKY